MSGVCKVGGLEAAGPRGAACVETCLLHSLGLSGSAEQGE